MGVVCGKGCWPREDEPGGFQAPISSLGTAGTSERGVGGASGLSREVLGSNGVSLQTAEVANGVGKNHSKAGPKRERRDEPPGGPGATEELLRNASARLDQINSGRLSGLPSVLKGVPGALASSFDATAGDASLETSTAQAGGPAGPPEEKEKDFRHTTTLATALRLTVVLQADGRTADLELGSTASLADLRRAAAEAFGLEGGVALAVVGGEAVSGEDSASLASAGVTDGARLILS